MQLEVGAVLDGKVTGITNFGAFVEIPGGKTGMVHISEVASTYVKEIRDHLTENQEVKVKVLSVGEDGKISLSIKRAMPEPEARPQRFERQPRSQGGAQRNGQAGRRADSFDWQTKRGSDNMSFEDMMAKFKQVSDEKMTDLKRGTESKHGGFSRRGGQK